LLVCLEVLRTVTVVLQVAHRKPDTLWFFEEGTADTTKLAV
jgi:hypothetical protein